MPPLDSWPGAVTTTPQGSHPPEGYEMSRGTIGRIFLTAAAADLRRAHRREQEWRLRRKMRVCNSDTTTENEGLQFRQHSGLVSWRG
uniref:Uncharacterized protein n=1 Tax=Timema cristinae TaxID=61476 RepID=A0A7R9H7F1_TIMCR|nr:unnamed protein product [Timema cristinae]